MSGLLPPPEHRFKPGVSDPRQSQGGKIAARTREILNADDKLFDRIVRRWLKSCSNGDNRALAMLLDRIDGPVEQRVSATIESRYVIEEVGVPYVDVPASVNAIQPASATDAPKQADMGDRSAPYVEQPQALTSSTSDNVSYVSQPDAEVGSVKSEGGASDPHGTGTLTHTDTPLEGTRAGKTPGISE